MSPESTAPESESGSLAEVDTQFALLLSMPSGSAGGVGDDLDRALELASSFFRMDFGIVSRVEGDAYFVEHVHQPEGAGIEVGQRFELGQTYCNITLDANDVVSIDEMRTSAHRGHPCYSCFGLEAYIGVPLVVQGKVHGTLNFSAPVRRLEPWSEEERQLVRLLARWVESSIAQERLASRLALALQELERANAELERKNADLDRFAHAASHDLQAPVRKLLFLTDVLSEDCGDELPAEVSQSLGLVQREAHRMDSLVRDLLEFSLAGSAEVELERVELEGCLDEALDALELHIGESGAAITRTPLPAVLGQGSLLTRVLQNLISNSIKFRVAQSVPRIEIGSERVGEQVELRVVDHGIGIEPEYADTIFAPFQRLHSADVYEGTGLGLSICRAIVESHGGRMRLEPTPGGGSTFVVSLAPAPWRCRGAGR